MSEESKDKDKAVWARVELMGHVVIAGRLSRPDEYGGLWQLDIPEGSEGDVYHTEFFGTQAVFRIRPVSEEIARAYALPGHDVVEYNAPIVTRAEHENAMARAREELHWAQRTVEELRRRLIAVKALPAPDDEDNSGYGDIPNPSRSLTRPSA